MNKLTACFFGSLVLLALFAQQSLAISCYECSNCAVPTSKVSCQSQYGTCVTVAYPIDSYGTMFTRMCAPTCPTSSGKFTATCCTTDYCNTYNGATRRYISVPVLAASMVGLFLMKKL